MAQFAPCYRIWEDWRKNLLLACRKSLRIKSKQRIVLVKKRIRTKRYERADEHSQNANPHKHEGERLRLREPEDQGVNNGGWQMWRNVTDGNHGGGISHFEAHLSLIDCENVGTNHQNSSDKEEDANHPHRVIMEGGVGRAVMTDESTNESGEGRNPIIWKCDQ